MSEFKFACPVCGQHIKVGTDKAGAQMECPTCFRNLVVPQPPTDASSSFVLTASEVHTRTIPLPGSTAATTPKAPTPKKSPAIVIALVAVVLCAAGGVFAFREKIFRSGGSTPPEEQESESTTNSQIAVVAAPSGPVGDDKLWLTNLADAKIPDSPASGRISGKAFTIERSTIKGGELNLRQGSKWPPDVGLTVYLFANKAEDLAGKKVSIEPDRDKSPRVVLRAKNDQGHPVTKDFRAGYSMRVEFGPATSGKLPGTIYFCAPDDGKSYVLGSFSAEIRKPSPPKK